MSKIDTALVEGFCKKFAPCVARNWADNHLNIYIRINNGGEPQLSCYGLGKVNWSGSCYPEDPFYKEFNEFLSTVASDVDEVQIKYFCGRVHDVDFVKWKKSPKEEAVVLETRLVITYRRILSGIRTMLLSYGVSGVWRLYEDKGSIFLSGSNGGCRLRNGSLSVYGVLDGKDIEAISLSLKHSLSMLSRKVDISVKEISFPVNDRDLFSGTFHESKDELGSYVIVLR